MNKIIGSNVTIMVKSMSKAIKFYENIGLKLQQKWGSHYAMIGAKGVTLGFLKHELHLNIRPLEFGISKRDFYKS